MKESGLWQIITNIVIHLLLGIAYCYHYKITIIITIITSTTITITIIIHNVYDRLVEHLGVAGLWQLGALGGAFGCLEVFSEHLPVPGLTWVLSSQWLPLNPKPYTQGFRGFRVLGWPYDAGSSRC